MLAHLRANLWLLVLTVLLCSVLYPLVLWGIGQTVFHDKAQGSLLTDAQGHPIGSQLIAQPFTADEYFQPRPSAASYNAAASGASNWAASNCLLRDRVARQLGPIVKYRSGPKKGQLVAPDIESWFQKDQFQGKPGIVEQWATLIRHRRDVVPELGQGRQTQRRVPGRLGEGTPRDVKKWKADNPDNPEPKPEDMAPGLAGPFFTSFSKDHPARSSAPSSTRPRTARRRNASSRSRKGPISRPASSTCG